MLQLIISVLLSFGFSFDNGKLVNPAPYSKEAITAQVKSDSEYERLGGDETFNLVIVTEGVDPLR